MIYIADISSIGVQHEQFNASFIKLLKNTFDEEELTVFSDEVHASILRKNIDQVAFEPIGIYGKRGGLKEFVRAYHQFKSLVKLIKRADERKVRSLIILLVHPFAHFLFKQFVSSRVEVTIVIHGELESVKFNKHFLNKIWGWFLQRALTIRSENVQYIILGESIYRNLLMVLPKFALQRTILLDHPYPFEPKTEKDSPSGQILLSSLGVATIAKNSQYFFELASEAAQAGLSRLSFHVCGRVYQNMQPYLNKFVSYKEKFEALTREELNELLQSSDFAVFYYDNKHYSLCSSGAFWDAINAEIPLLYVKNDYFDYYSKKVGALGIRFSTHKELNNYVLLIGEKGISQIDYQQFKLNIQKLKYDYMSSGALGRQIADLLPNMGEARKNTGT